MYRLKKYDILKSCDGQRITARQQYRECSYILFLRLLSGITKQSIEQLGGNTAFQLLGCIGTSFFEMNDPKGLHRNYWLPVGAFGDMKADARKIEEGVDEIAGKYVSTNPIMRLQSFEIKRVENFGQYAGWVKIAYNEEGEHFVRYNEQTATFTSDGFFGEETDPSRVPAFDFDRNSPLARTYDVSPYNNDQFTIKVVSYGNYNERMLLKTNQYELRCIPEELLIDAGVKCKAWYTAGRKLQVYTEPDRLSESVIIQQRVKIEVLERQTKWEEFEGELSMWYRIRTESGEEGWVWDRDIYLDRDEYSRWV